jgi:hypothetical protein
MRRYQYRLNDQNVSLAGWGQVTPLKYMETVPGDTVGGTITVKARSALTDKVIHSRAYYDLYAFYCPIRLLWDKFPEFLAGSSGDVAQPVTTTLFPQNFEHSFIGGGAMSDAPLENGTNTAYLRRMYYMIFKSFFAVDRMSSSRHVQEAVRKVRAGDYDNINTLYSAATRESTYDESWNNYEEDEGVQIKTDTEGNFTLDQVRRAYSLDRFEKMRDFYGSRYTDILKGYGIKADWGILQEPECIGISNNDWRFVKKSSTGDNSFGDEKGYFEGEYKLKLRKTFCPEHGIVGIFAVPRADVFNQFYAGHILGTRNLGEPTVWYDPVAWSSANSQKFSKRVISYAAQRGTFAETQLGEHLRKGRNEHAVPVDTDWSTLPVFARQHSANAIAKPEDWRREMCTPPSPQVKEGEEKNAKINVEKGDIVHYTEVRVSKRSPVQPGHAHVRR